MKTDTRCHSCGAEGLEVFYEVKRIPVHSCLMVSTQEQALAFPKGDLALAFCAACGLIQNSCFDPDLQQYSTEYEDSQAFSPRFRRFATNLCQSQIEKYNLRGKTVLEIGCGKGEFLVELCKMGDNRGIGIDPSYRPERTSSEGAARIQFIQDFYSEEYSHLAADYVCCRHTLEHIQPVYHFVRMIRRTLEGRPDTIVFFEVPDVERVLEEQAFWDIYYEHCTYFTLGSLVRLFRSCDFQILGLYKCFNDQYLMIESRPGNGAQGRRFDVEDDLERTARNVELFQEKISATVSRLRADLDRIAARGQRAVIWGSGSKAVSYLTTLGITEEIEYIVDINPYKHGKFMAGTRQEIVSPGFLKEYRPDVVIVMNSIYSDEIRVDLEAMGLSPEMTSV